MSKTVNDLVGAISERVNQLADLKMPELRLTHPQVEGTGTNYEGNQVTLGMTRGQIIADIILDEFSLEFDKDIEEE
jgi:hypothetical protein